MNTTSTDTGLHTVSVLALPTVLPLELGIATQIFGTDPFYKLTICAERRTNTASRSDFTITVDASLEALEGADTVIVPGYNIATELSPTVLRALAESYASGARVISICSGAFAIAAAGLLDGRPATTHWRFAEEFRRRHPSVQLHPNRLYVDDGDVLTSAGMTAGIDLCLHVIRKDQGAAVANNHARTLVAPPQRDGGQAQYIEMLRADPRGGELAALRGWMLANLSSPMNVDTLARRAHMSRRTFVRRFREETGTSPMAWLSDARIDFARELLETTSEPIERIGDLTGLGAPASVRASFHRRIGTSPQAYRATFQQRRAVAAT
jgi:transcriptional regulator GlxA family with amidase domain